MRKLKIGAALVALSAAGVLACWLYQTGLLVGWVRGEAFYQGRPTSYWSRELSQWDGPSLFTSWVPSQRTVYRNEIPVVVYAHSDAVIAHNGWVVSDPLVLAGVEEVNPPVVDATNTIWFDLSFYSRQPSFLDRLAGYVGVTFEYPDRPAILTGDPAAAAVLNELLDDPSEQVRNHARAGLRQLRLASARPLANP